MALNTVAVAEKLSAYRHAPRWLVAYSGGVDSLVLLQLLVDIPQRPPLLAVHVNHGLQTPSDQWERHCRQRADELGVAFHSERAIVDTGGALSPEQAAREARYAVFESLLQSGEVLLMAHHLDDQVETLLLRMLRGSGSRGLAAIPETRPLGKGILLRPLLDQTREAIEQYARERGWQWIEDPSNDDPAFDRNYLRRRVLPVIAGRWPDYRATLARVAALSEESSQLNRELAELDCHALSLSPLAASLPISALRELSPGRLKNLLRFWLQSRDLALPSAAQMRVLIDDVIEARRDAEPLLAWPGVQVRRFRDEIYAMEPLLPPPADADCALTPQRPVTVDGVGTVMLEKVRGSGIRATCLEGAGVELRFRRGGERCRPRGRAASQTLKKLMQEYGVESWLRERVPLIYVDGQLAAVADYWVCEGFAAAADEDGYRCRWQRRLGPSRLSR